jgi:hypothetical protein
MGIVPTKWRNGSVCWLGLGTFTLACALCLAGQPASGQTAPTIPPSPEFTRLADKLAADRAAGGVEAEPTEEQALEILDRAALGSLNAGAPDLEALNARLAAFVTRQPPLGEGFRGFQLGGNPSSFALLADFGEGGPSAVRIYAGSPGKLSLAARIDRYAQKDFLDDYIDLVPVPGSAALFITVAGRTDDFETGVFTAWHFDGHEVKPVWTSDIVEQSSYEVNSSGFQLTYCDDSNPDDPRACHQMRRERFVWQDGAWKQVASETLSPSDTAR